MDPATRRSVRHLSLDILHRTPTVAEVAQAHAHIRAETEGRVTDWQETRLLYGGSVKPENAAELLHMDNVNGALVGGASLEAGSFLAIALAAIGP